MSKKVTSVGVQPATSIAEVMARPSIELMSEDDIRHLLTEIGFSAPEIEGAITKWRIRMQNKAYQDTCTHDTPIH